MNRDFIDANLAGNRIQSFVLIVAMVGILALIGFLFGGTIGAGLAIGVCVIAIVFGPAISPHVIMRMYHAQPIPRGSSPELLDMFAEIVRRAGLPTSPVLYYVPSRTLNAFAVGRQSNSAIAVTDGLLRMLNAREIAGVLAHEVSHIRHKDMWVLGIADTVSRVTATLSQLGQLMLFLAIPTFLMYGGVAFLILAALLIGLPVISNLLQLALSRSREFNADLGAVALTGDAQGLASALVKLERINSGNPFPWIITGSKTETYPGLLRTHPPTDERIRRIMEAGKPSGGAEPLGPAATAAPRLVSPPGRHTAAGRDSPSGRLSPTDRQRVRRGPGWHVAGLWY